MEIIKITTLIKNYKTPNPLRGDHRLSSYSGAAENNTQKDLTDQEDLLKKTELENETTPKPTNLSPLEQANADNAKNNVKNA